MRCQGDKHDLRFVYHLPDDIQTFTVYDEDGGPPTVTEVTTTKLECRLCYRTIFGEPHERTFQPEPSSVTYSPDGIEYHYDY